MLLWVIPQSITNLRFAASTFNPPYSLYGAFRFEKIQLNLAIDACSVDENESLYIVALGRDDQLLGYHDQVYDYDWVNINDVKDLKYGLYVS
jgi:isopentenyldiphosphate isomerase